MTGGWGAAEWAALISALGVGAILQKGAEVLWKWLGGRAGAQRDAVQEERKRAREAEDRADVLDRKLDVETKRRRVATEYAARLRRHNIEHCDATGLPEWPAELLE
jgi:hypothetical protein